MRFGLLGSLEVRDDSGEPVELGGVQARTVLAVLLAAGGRVVTADALLDAVWGDDQPPSASGTLQSYISRLRRALEPGRDRGAQAKLLVWEPPGYRLAVPADDVDFRLFERLADEGRSLLAAGRAGEAREALEAADALWRGSALVEFADREFATGLATRLEERRLAAAEDRIAADLALGRHGAVIGELSQLVAAHPLREALRGQLALALYRSGRQADALRALDDARTVLREELGVDLGPRLRELEAAILAHDPALDVPAPAAAPAQAWPEPQGPAPVQRTFGDGLIGRVPEMTELLAALAEAAAATRAVVVEGEPGIGKTRLVEELASEATVRGALVLWGRAFEGGAAPAFWPWLPPLRTLVARQPDGTDIAPEIATLLSPDVGPERAVAAAEQGRFALTEGVIALIASVARAHPVVLILDDVQWADDASLDLLTLVAGRLDDVPLLVVCTVRELEVGRNDGVVDALASLSRHPGTRRLHLRGLSREATAELVARTTGHEIAPDLAAAIYDRAEGNPFFTTELARLVGSAGDRAASKMLADVPSGVRDVVRRRLTQLPEPTVELLHVAAVIGRDVDLTLLTRASGRDLDACLDALDPAVVHRLLVDVPELPGTYRFAHALVREVVADDISSLKRARLHLRVADALDDTDDTAEILAEHLWAAASIGAAERAAAALERAARVAVRRLAYGSAIHLLERAVQLRRSLGSAPDDLNAELRALALLVSAIAALHGYASLNGSPLLARGKLLAERTGRTSEMLHLLWAEWAGLDVACEHRRADPIAEQLLQLSFESDDPLAPVLGHSAFGISRWHRGELTASSEHLDAARAGIRSVRLPDMLLFDLDQLRLASPFSVYVHVLRGDIDDAEARFDEVVREIPDDAYWELLVMNFAASGAISVGEFAEAERAARRGIAVDPEYMSAFWSVALRAYLGLTICLQGRLDEGLPILDAAWARYLAIGVRTNSASWGAGRALALAEAGRVDEASESLAEAERNLHATGEGYARPLLLLADGSLRRARGDDPAGLAAVLRDAFELATAQGGHGIARRIAHTASGYGIGIPAVEDAPTT